MRYYWRVFLWENGHRSTEFTKYTNAPIFLEDKLDETLDSGEIILMGMPISTKAAFPPKTKFRLERHLKADFSDAPKKWDMIVEHDDVEEYTGEPSLCTHRIYLIEASAVAQGMHVDNISLTYELQDVNLNYKTVRQDDTPIGNDFNVQNGGYEDYEDAVHREDEIEQNKDGQEHLYYFINTYQYVWDRLEGVRSLARYVHVGTEKTISFAVPRLMCRGCYHTGTGFVDLFEMNTVTRVYSTKRLKGTEIINSKTLEAEIYSGATSFTPNDDMVFYSNGTEAALVAIKETEKIFDGGNGDSFLANRTTLPTLATADGSYQNKNVIFKTRALSEQEILMGYDYVYTIECAANPTNPEGMLLQYEGYAIDCKNSNGNIIPNWFTYGSLQQTKCNPSEVYLENAKISCEDMSEDADGGVYLMKGAKYCCYDLLQKALLTVDTQIVDNSIDGIDDLWRRYPIIVDESWVIKLKSVKTFETIFEQKNLWEILLQIGYYLHAIPYLEFTDDGTDRFVLRFRQLGETKKKEDANTKITVFNSRNLSDYFTLYDSYVTNLFSPQNEVDEWLVVKTSDSSYLISNNTAELRTSRPILEITAFEIYKK